ncbi:unnamed protein product [Owenia fusiformis]|uniref:rhomboid protease n=1 Tax=Owenia fusiformis TaxID=6347 RepID=A0A8J1UQV4_OWEFU|nr:unnamed protein product [Owenia fusiformis]
MGPRNSKILPCPAPGVQFKGPPNYNDVIRNVQAGDAPPKYSEVINEIKQRNAAECQAGVNSSRQMTFSSAVLSSNATGIADQVPPEPSLAETPLSPTSPWIPLTPTSSPLSHVTSFPFSTVTQPPPPPTKRISTAELNHDQRTPARNVISMNQNGQSESCQNIQMNNRHFPDKCIKFHTFCCTRVTSKEGGDTQKLQGETYRCWPPPLFTTLITFLQIVTYVCFSLRGGEIRMAPNITKDNVFVYDPERRYEAWRFVLYSLLHVGWIHLFFNLLVQVMVGIPLEMVHGTFRIAAIYFAGVLAGSLGSSVFDPEVRLVGASGGVYALLAAHLANILLNYSQMELGLLKLLSIFMISISDVGFAIWNRAVSVTESDGPQVGYVAHIAGALAGLAMGLIVLKNFEKKLYERVIWWCALILYFAWLIFAIAWNFL